MIGEPIAQFWVHPAQLTAMKHTGTAEPATKGVYVTSFGQILRVCRYVPPEGLFLLDSAVVKEARKTEAGDERRRAQLEEYRKITKGKTK